ncbi:MAG TPA: glycoside hydrolase family 97 protein [Opitutaceae bacterium]
MSSRLPPLLSALALFAALAFPALAWAADLGRFDHSVDSPDGHIRVSIAAEGPLAYRVSLDGTPVLNESRMGLRLRGGVVLGDDVTFVSQAGTTVDTAWTNPLGKRSQVRDHHNELALSLREKGENGRAFSVVFRVFNDGVGFRYEMPKDKGADDFVVDEELTQFAFTTDSECYAGDHAASPPDAYDSRGGFRGSQEWEFRKERLADLSAETVTGLPLLTHTPAAWVAVTEADLTDWAGMWLAREPQEAGTTAVTLRSRLAPRFDGNGLVKGTLPHPSPWRVLLLGREPGRLIESDVIVNLSTPCEIADPSWVKPGMMAWDCWWSGLGQMDAGTMSDFIRFAGEMGWPYQLIDAGWYPGTRHADSDIMHPVPQVEMDRLLKEAAENNVRLWVWLYWTDVDQHDAYKEAFALYEKWGIAGVKIDFMDRDDQEMVNWYEKITRCAAEHHLLVDFHGAFKPTGMIRTWPNQITREGILGNEYNKWSRRVTPEHRTTLPFTRFLAGPGDFTPGGFNNRQGDKFQTGVTPSQVQGTRAGQLALFVAYDSPVMCVADHPVDLRGKPGIDFLRIVPTTWDDTRVLSGVVAEHLVVARRHGDEWFLGALNNSSGRVKSVKLDFLPKGRWHARLWHDAPDSGENGEHIAIDERDVSTADTLDLRMASGGGAVAHFVREP